MFTLMLSYLVVNAYLNVHDIVFYWAHSLRHALAVFIRTCASRKWTPWPWASLSPCSARLSSRRSGMFRPGRAGKQLFTNPLLSNEILTECTHCRTQEWLSPLHKDIGLLNQSPSMSLTRRYTLRRLSLFPRAIVRQSTPVHTPIFTLLLLGQQTSERGEGS